MLKKLSKYSDKELFKALKSKKSESEAAFSEVYARYSQRIFAYCLRVIGSEDDAKDIFQETFISFYNSIEKHDYIDNIYGFLIRTARHLCLNYKRDKKVMLDFNNFNICTKDEDFEKKDLMQIVSSALELIDFDSREAFVLRQYQGLSYKEIAEITKEPISTVKNRAWRAKEKIKDILSPILEDLSK